MSPSPASAFLEPQWFVPLFVLMWVGISAILSLLSGWSALAATFRADGSARGERFRFVSGSMGAGTFPVNYGRCLFVSIDDKGFGLTILFLFRALTPPLYIPWTGVESVTERRFLFLPYAAVRIRDQWPIVCLYGKAGKRMLEVYERAPGK